MTTSTVNSMEVFKNGNFSVRKWTPSDRDGAAQVVKQCLEPYGLQFEPQGADLDAIDVEEHYLKNERGEFWVVIDVRNQRLVGTGGYYEVSDPGTVEIRKMYLLPEARGKKLGRAILEKLEEVIRERGYRRIYIETASVLFEACQLYQSAGYLPVEGVETLRCDQKLYKHITT